MNKSSEHSSYECPEHKFLSESVKSFSVDIRNIYGKINSIESKMSESDNRITGIEGRIENIGNKIENIEDKLNTIYDFIVGNTNKKGLRHDFDRLNDDVMGLISYKDNIKKLVPWITAMKWCVITVSPTIIIGTITFMSYIFIGKIKIVFL